jgi:leader peptidase (prepilin peptidase)/N-methyltransferase
VALSIEDINSRRIPRLWVILGATVQLLVFICWTLINGNLSSLVVCVLLAFGSTAIQFLVVLIKPGIIGFGDVTCTFVVALAVAWLGVTTTLIWWCLMGILGVIGIAVFARRNGSIAFAPVITIAMILAIMADAMSPLLV